jgi:hypothetical protein
MKRTRILLAGGVVVAVLLAAAAVYWLRTPAADDFDYAAAFEQPAAAAAQTGASVDIKALAGRTPAEVQALIGPASDCEQALHSRRCDYAQSPVQIVFIDGRADWFTVRAMGQELQLAPETLARFGLPVAEPQEQTQRENVWHDLAGLKEVRMVGDEYGVSYVRIKAFTP